MTRSIPSRLSLSLAALCVALALPGEAAAWRQSKTCHATSDILLGAPSLIPPCEGDKIPIPMAWPTQEVFYKVSNRGASSIDGESATSLALYGAIVSGVRKWNKPACSEFELIYDGTTSIPGHVSTGRPDGVNVIAFIDEADWIETTGAVAITISTVIAGSGRLVDADIEFNERDFDFSIAPHPPPDRHDVMNVVAHEAGHMVGFDESDVPEATMYYAASLGETQKRDLSADDIEGLCTVYELGSKPPPPDDAGCSIAPSPEPGPAIPTALALAGLFAWRRRRSSTRPLQSAA